MLFRLPNRPLGYLFCNLGAKNDLLVNLHQGQRKIDTPYVSAFISFPAYPDRPYMVEAPLESEHCRLPVGYFLGRQ